MSSGGGTAFYFYARRNSDFYIHLLEGMPPKKRRDSSSSESSQSSAEMLPKAKSKGAKEIPFRNIQTLEIPPDSSGVSVVMYGSTRSGKTTMLNYLYEKLFKDYISILMSNSLQNDSYKFLKKKCVTSDMYHPEILKDAYKINHETKNHYKFCMILDDITDHRMSSEIVKLFTIYRNSRISAIVGVQSVVMMNKTARANINFICLGRLNNDLEIEMIIKSYLTSYLPTTMRMADKITWYRQQTNDHHFLIIDQIGNDIFRTKLTPQQVLV